MQKKSVSNSTAENADARSALKERREKRNRLFRRAALLFLLFSLFELIYQVILFIERNYGFYGDVAFFLYLFAAFVLLLVFVILNHGFSRAPVTEEMITGAYTKDRRIRMAEKINRGKKRARTVLYFLLPIVLVLLFDLIDLFFITPLFAAI